MPAQAGGALEMGVTSGQLANWFDVKNASLGLGAGCFTLLALAVLAVAAAHTHGALQGAWRDDDAARPVEGSTQSQVISSARPLMQSSVVCRSYTGG